MQHQHIAGQWQRQPRQREALADLDFLHCLKTGAVLDANAAQCAITLLTRHCAACAQRAHRCQVLTWLPAGQSLSAALGVDQRLIPGLVNQKVKVLHANRTE